MLVEDMSVFPEQIKDGHLILDLNKVYNPWCAYGDGYSCRSHSKKTL